jgi:hypothetical protein
MQLKKDVLAILQHHNLEEIFNKIAAYDSQKLINPLFSALCHREDHVRWSAVFCFGRIVPMLAERDLESARTIMRRFLWSLNDESGGIGWGVPEAMAEVMCHSTVLRQEYRHMFISYMRKDGEELFQDGNFLELPMLQRGLLWGMGRLCQQWKKEMLGLQIIDDIAAYLDSEDLYVKGYALWCLLQLGSTSCKANVTPLLSDHREVDLFIDHRITTCTISQLASRVLSC